MLPNFTPSPVVAHILHNLLDLYERRYTARLDYTAHQPLRFDVQAAAQLDYHSQIDPMPRQLINEQLRALEQLGWIKLAWLPGDRQGPAPDDMRVRKMRLKEALERCGADIDTGQFDAWRANPADETSIPASTPLILLLGPDGGPLRPPRD